VPALAHVEEDGLTDAGRREFVTLGRRSDDAAAAKCGKQLLFQPATQLSMLDGFADTKDQRSKVREIFLAWKQASDSIAELEGADQAKLRLLDLCVSRSCNKNTAYVGYSVRENRER